MTRFKKSLLAAALSLGASSVLAVPMFEAGGNDIGFFTYENQYRSDTNCTTNGGCLGAGTGPTGFQLVDPTIVGNTLMGDVFAGVIKVREIVHYVDGTQWNSGDNGVEFTGYFAQEILNDPATTPGPTAGTNILQLGSPTVDPFGLLSDGAQVQLYVDPLQDFNLNGTTATSLASATNGTLWGELGTIASNGGDVGYNYTIDDPTLAGAAQFTDKNYLALNLLLPPGAAYNAYDLGLVNDPSESLQGGVTAGNFLPCSLADQANPAVVCTNFAGQDDIRGNPAGPLGSASPTSPWYYIANDPLSINTSVPEPATLALLGIGLMGLGGLRRRAV